MRRLWVYALGALVEIDVGCVAEGAEIFVVYPRNHRASAKVLALIDSLRESFGDPPYWEREDSWDGAS
jgi:DNA-binding transcriptional LysR family regulator